MTPNPDRAKDIALAALRQRLARLRPGSPEYRRLSEQIFDLMAHNPARPTENKP